MPSNKKKAIKARRAETGESHATARDRVEGRVRLKHGRYSGTPSLPSGPTTIYLDGAGFRLPHDGTQSEFEFVNIQGEFDPRDLKKASVPESAFDDPTMPRAPSWPAEIKRVLTLAEYIDARSRQTGRRLARIQPGPGVALGRLFGIDAPPVVLHVILVWSPLEPAR